MVMLEAIAVIVATFSCLLVSTNYIVVLKKRAKSQKRLRLLEPEAIAVQQPSRPLSEASMSAASDNYAINAEEELGKAATRYLEQKKSLKLIGEEKRIGEKRIGKFLAQYLSEHENELIKRP
jgi:hypothetical protein